jgi:two-component system, LytTR family, response regulator
MAKLIIVEDEIAISKYLAYIVKENFRHSIEVVGIAHNTCDAAALLDSHHPEISLFDIHIPHENAIDFLAKREDKTNLVFITAYDGYAMAAFKLHAVDFLTKPVNEESLITTLQWILDNKIKQGTEPAHEVIKSLNVRDQLTINTHNGKYFIPLADILFVEASGSYCIFNYSEKGDTKKITASKPLNYFEDILGPNFVRIHKSTIANLRHAKVLDSNRNLVLHNATTLEVSARRVTEVMKLLSNKP